ncbi:FAD-binding protein [Nonomuraea angiospora]
MPVPLEHLRPRLNGALILPGDPGWDAARSAWQLAVDQRPAAVVLARTACDVATTLEAARTAGLRVAPQGSGHNAAPLGPLDDTILLRTFELAHVHIDPDRRLARVGAGVPAARYAWTPRASRTCSGRSGAAEAASRWSPSWSSPCSPSARCTRGRCTGRSSGPRPS